MSVAPPSGDAKRDIPPLATCKSLQNNVDDQGESPATETVSYATRRKRATQPKVLVARQARRPDRRPGVIVRLGAAMRASGQVPVRFKISRDQLGNLRRESMPHILPPDPEKCLRNLVAVSS